MKSSNWLVFSLFCFSLFCVFMWNVQRSLKDKSFTLEELKLFIEMRRASKQPREALWNLIRSGGGGLVFPKEPEPQKDPEFERRKAWLLAREEQRQYNASVGNVRGKIAPTRITPEFVGVRAVFKELSVAFAMLLMCAGVFFALKMFAEIRGLSRSTGLVWGLCGAIMMLFIETILYVIRSTREERFERQKTRFMENQVTNISNLPVQPKTKTKATPKLRQENKIS